MKEIIIEILRKELGQAEDNLYRAKMQFAGKSVEQMNSEYGKSGMTFIEMLGMYTERVKEVKNCIEWVKKHGKHTN